MKAIEIKPFEAVGEIKFSMQRHEIFQILGKPRIYINELLMPGIMIDKYHAIGYEIYYDFQNELCPFAIDVNAKSKCRLKGLKVFGKTLSEVRSSISEKEGYSYELLMDGKVHIREIGVTLNFQENDENEEAKVYSLVTYKRGFEGFIEERMRGPRPQVAYSAQEMEKRYGHLYRTD